LVKALTFRKAVQDVQSAFLHAVCFTAALKIYTWPIRYSKLPVLDIYVYSCSM